MTTFKKLSNLKLPPRFDNFQKVVKSKVVKSEFPPQLLTTMKLKKILISSPIILILILTMLLLEFIGYGEAKRKYTQFQLTRLATQGEIIKHEFDSYLHAGLPLKQFSGFSNQSERLLLSDDSIQAIQVTDNQNKMVFLNGQHRLTLDKLEEILSSRQYFSSQFTLEQNHRAEESATSFRVILPLDTRFGVVGQVIIESEKEALFQVLNKQFWYVFYAVITLTVIFILLIVIYEIYFANHKTRERFLKTTYIIEFIVMSMIISVVIFQVYEYGARASTKALSNSMSQRLSAILELGIRIEDISRINQTFQDYKKNNPHINQIALTRNNIVMFHTDEQVIGKPYQSAPNSFEYVVPLGNTEEKQLFRVAVSIPVKIVMSAIWSSAKAFIVLFIACGLISFIFLDAGTTLLTVRERSKQVTALPESPESPLTNLPFSNPGNVIPPLNTAAPKKLSFTSNQSKPLTPPQPRAIVSEDDTRFQIGLRLVKPAYFLIVFVNALSVSFLPQLANSMAEQSGSGFASASLPFSIFYTWFALVLIPAGYYAEKGNLKKLMAVGFLSEVIGLTLVALTADFWILTVGRMFSGIGQGVFLIGLQSYILAITPKNKQTQGGAVKVTGRNAGMIAGTSIGALLFVYLSYQTLFMIASVLTLLASVYLWILVPGVEEITHKPLKSKATEKISLLQFVRVFKDFEFLHTLILIGLTSKIAIAGVVMFAVPLVLSKTGFASEDIGLGLMLFYISSMVVTHYISQWVDHLGQTRWVLSISSPLGGLGILLFGLLGASPWAGPNIPGILTLSSLASNFHETLTSLGLLRFENYLLYSFLILAGISNGLSTAPLLTHINKTAVAEKYGHKSISATYTFLERGGHILGPIVVSQLLALDHQNTLGLTLFGIVMMVSGFWFQLWSRK